MFLMPRFGGSVELPSINPCMPLLFHLKQGLYLDARSPKIRALISALLSGVNDIGDTL